MAKQSNMNKIAETLVNNADEKLPKAKRLRWYEEDIGKWRPGKRCKNAIWKKFMSELNGKVNFFEKSTSKEDQKALLNGTQLSRKVKDVS